MDYRTYRLIDRDQTHSDRTIQRNCKRQKILPNQKRDQVSDASNPISILSSLMTFKTACDSNGISAGAARWLMHFFMRKPLNDTHSSSLQLKSRRSSVLNKKDGSLFASAEVVIHLPPTSATDDVIAEIVPNIQSTTQGPSIPATDNSNALQMKVLRCGQVCDEAQLKAFFHRRAPDVLPSELSDQQESVLASIGTAR